MIVKPHIIIQHIIDISQYTRRMMANIWTLQNFVLDKQSLFIFINGSYIQTQKQIQVLFPKHKITLNTTVFYHIPIKFNNIHNLRPLFAVRFEEPERAAYLLPLHDDQCQFYIENQIFYLTQQCNEIKTLKVELIEQFDPTPCPLYKIYIDFEAYDQVHINHQLQIYPSEIGAAVSQNNELISTFHEFIKKPENASNRAFAITQLDGTLGIQLSTVLDDFWTFCERFKPYILIAKNKFMEQHVLKVYVHEYSSFYNQQFLHSNYRQLDFSCYFHSTLCLQSQSNYSAFKVHCALDDAILLHKMASGNVQILAEIDEFQTVENL
ncbi:hypothetical protein SS50377_20194 [Spironucleus salmonicida]|uniref:Uncharacterized protein n=1 Tax=Spironucleus salmonicida TaxID=348837 RepID=V6LWS2_9EUKA|nr:hypothetical protein SS50377_20194 [Spironucleus salmonicida]|eukprot:EST45249.1 Hypothetical protein SS50377_14825 [Spironucleus salmonicida]